MYRGLEFLLLAASLTFADGPIRLPVQDPPAPLPAPASDVTKLPTGSLFVVDSDVPVVVMASPKGMVSISPEEGPMKIRGVFAGSPKVQTKTFKGKYLFLVEAEKSGRCELFIIPVGLKGEQDVIRRTLEVGDGTNPQPPPGPGPQPVSPLAEAVQKAFDQDGSPTKGADAKKLAAVFRQATEKVAAAPALFTAGEFAAMVAKARADAVDDRIPGVREPLSAELVKLGLPDQANVVLSAEQRAAIKTLFTTFATILEGLK
jgi:hypothetical protein